MNYREKGCGRAARLAITLIALTIGAVPAVSAAVPERVLLLAPSASSSSTTPTFSWKAVPQTTYYLLRVTDWTNVAIDRWYSPTDAGCASGSTSCAVSLDAPLPPGPVTWQVLSWSAEGYGPWSEPITFTIDVADPLAAVPQPISPAGTLGSYDATYTWSAVPAAVIYRLAISMNAEPETYRWLSPASLGCANAPNACSVALTALANGNADWRVQAWTVNGSSNWSTAMGVTFTVFPAPAPPLAIGPTGSAGASPTFSWSAAAHVVYYNLVVDDSTGRRVDQWLTPGEAGCLTEGTTCTVTPAVVLAAGQAQWQVFAWNPSGYSPFPPIHLFTVSSGGSTFPNQVPGRVIPVGPSGLLTGTPTFTWQAQPAATYYLVRVIDWTGAFIDRWFTPADASCALGTGVCAASFGTTVTPGPAAWKIVAYSPAGYSPWSEDVELVLDKVDPLAIAPQPLAPAGSLWSHTATFTWTAAPNATLYRLSLTTDGGSPVDSWLTPSELGCSGAGPCGVVHTVASNGLVHWKVQAWTALGRSKWSAPMDVSFAVFPAPTAPIPLGPGAPTKTLTFTWTAPKHAVYYLVQIEDVRGDRIEQRMSSVQAGCAETPTCAFTTTAALHAGRASWRVLAWNPSGASPWSSTQWFEIQSGGRK